LFTPKTFGHLSDRAKKTEIDRVLTQEHYISNKVFVSRERIIAFLRMLDASPDLVAPGIRAG